MPHKTTADRALKTLSGRFRLPAIGLLCSSLLAVSCASEQPAPPRRKAPPAPNVAPATLNSTPVEEAIGTELMQKSVARVLGFVDIGNTAQTVFQDTESSLYESIATKLSTPEGTAPDPIFYYSPVFIAGSPKLLPLPNGKLNVTIPNLYTQQAIRETIQDDMADVLAAYNIRVEKIGLIPMENIKVRVKAFGNTYEDDVEMDNEFRTIVFNIPAADVPQLVIDELKQSADTGAPGEIFLNYLSLITIDYDYFVQQYGKQECRMNVSSEDIRNMYMDQEGCPPGPDQAEVDAALAWVTANHANKESAADSVNSKLAGILNRSSVVTACAAAKEARKLQGAASVSCTKGGTRDSDQDGTTGYSPMVIDFLKNTIEPHFKSLIARPTESQNWDDQLIAATIQMFGSPERFKSTVEEINSEIQNKDVTELDNDYYDNVAWFSDQLRNYDTYNQADTYLDSQGRVINQAYDQDYVNNIQTSTEQNSKGGGGGLNLGFGGFGIGFGNSSGSANGKSSGSNQTQYQQNYKASDEFKRDYQEFHNIARAASLETDTNAEERTRQTSQYLYDMGYDHSIEKVGGQFNIFPRLNIAVRAEANRAEQFANRFATNELGNIVQETEQIPVQLKNSQDAELVIRFKCSASEASWTGTKAYLTTYQWWRKDSFWKQISDAATEAILQGGCSFLAVKMWYRNAAFNTGMIPEVVDITVHGLVEKTLTSPPDAQGNTESVTYFEKSLPIAIELRRGNAEATPVEGSLQIDAGSSRFTKLKISQQ